MLIWILILSPWVVLLSLILHDATKADNDGGALTIAAQNFKALTFWAIKTAISEPSGKVATAAKAIFSSSKLTGPIKQTSAPLPEKKWGRDARRVSIAMPELESVISEAVKEAAPSCEDFAGVLVHYNEPKSLLDPNWAIRGVKFGKADRKMANEALTTVVTRMQREFQLSDD